MCLPYAAAQGECWAIRKHQDTALGVGKCSLRPGKARAGLEIPRSAMRLGLWGSQTFRHPGMAGYLRRAEN